MQKNIALMAGGNSSEYEISLGSAAQIVKILDKTKYNTYQVYVRGHRWYYKTDDGTETDVDKNDFSLTLNGEKIVFEYALILIHGTPGENGLLQAYFEMMEIPYSSCDFVCSAVTFDKSLCKKALVHTGIAMAKEVLLNRGDRVDPEAIVAKLGLPMFVKPNASGSSCGVTKVKRTEEIVPAVEAALKEGDQVIIEEFLDGCEVDCGLMVIGGKPYIFPPTEIVSKNEFFDYEAKYTPGMSDEITPARISEKATAELQKTALTIYRTLNCRGVVRMDFIIRDEIPFLIEVNTVPGMSEGSIVPKQARVMGMSLTELFNLVIEDTFNR